jgi:outer membrane protein OmpA-like peptidoglycan-associated protein
MTFRAASSVRPVVAFCAALLLAAAAEVRTFRLYFLENGWRLTPEAEALVQEAADYARAAPSEIVVHGHTDTLGPRWRNLRLSRRRARVVGDALVASEVPAKTILLRWSGETNPPHPTPDETYEPLNRSAVITVERTGNGADPDGD